MIPYPEEDRSFFSLLVPFIKGTHFSRYQALGPPSIPLRDMFLDYQRHVFPYTHGFLSFLLDAFLGSRSNGVLEARRAGSLFSLLVCTRV